MNPTNSLGAIVDCFNRKYFLFDAGSEKRSEKIQINTRETVPFYREIYF